MGSFQLKFAPWNSLASLASPKVPSYGGWIKIRNLPLDRWDEETFKIIGNSCGGYIEASKKTRSRFDLMEATIRVKKNTSGFIPAHIPLLSKDTDQLTIQIDPFFTSEHFIGYSTGIHGALPPENRVFRPEDDGDGLLGPYPRAPHPALPPPANLPPSSFSDGTLPCYSSDTDGPTASFSVLHPDTQIGPSLENEGKSLKGKDIMGIREGTDHPCPSFSLLNHTPVP